MLMMTSNLPRSPLRRCSLPQLTRAHAFSSVTRPKIWERTPPVRWGALPCQVGLMGVQGGAARTRSVLAVDVVPQNLLDKYSDQLGRLARGEEAVFDEIFKNAAPKFVYPGHLKYSDASNPVTFKDVS